HAKRRRCGPLEVTAKMPKLLHQGRHKLRPERVQEVRPQSSSVSPNGPSPLARCDRVQEDEEQTRRPSTSANDPLSLALPPNARPAGGATKSVQGCSAISPEKVGLIPLPFR